MPTIIGTIPDQIVAPRLELFVYQSFDFFAQNIINLKFYIAFIRYFKTDGGGWVEGVGIIMV